MDTTHSQGRALNGDVPEIDDKSADTRSVNGSVGEAVIFEKLQRDTILGNLDPLKLRDIQAVIALHSQKNFISGADLKRYFEAWGYSEEDFALARWKEMELDAMKTAVEGAHPDFIHKEPGLRPVPVTKLKPVFPFHRRPLDNLATKEEIMEEYGCLAYIPREVYRMARSHLEVLRLSSSKAGIEELQKNSDTADALLVWACGAALDTSVIEKLVESCGARDVSRGAYSAAEHGHHHILDWMIKKYGKRVHLCDCILGAAAGGRNATIDYLVETYGIDPAGYNDNFETPLHDAAAHGHLDTIRHLVETHRVDVSPWSEYRETPMDWAAEEGHMDCVELLRAYGGEHGEELDLFTSDEE